MGSKWLRDRTDNRKPVRTMIALHEVKQQVRRRCGESQSDCAGGKPAALSHSQILWAEEYLEPGVKLQTHAFAPGFVKVCAGVLHSAPATDFPTNYSHARQYSAGCDRRSS